MGQSPMSGHRPDKGPAPPQPIGSSAGSGVTPIAILEQQLVAPLETARRVGRDFGLEIAASDLPQNPLSFHFSRRFVLHATLPRGAVGMAPSYSALDVTMAISGVVAFDVTRLDGPLELAEQYCSLARDNDPSPEQVERAFAMLCAAGYRAFPRPT
jgi:hypothetical protein